MLDGLFVTPAVTAIEEALASARSGASSSASSISKIAVVGNPKLAAALAKAKQHDVIPVAMPKRTKLANAIDDLSSLEPGTLDAVIGVDATIDDGWERTLHAWSRAVRDGGSLILVDRGRSPEASRRALCAGLAEIEQRRAGRVVVTSGLVTQL